ncbi:cysteine hydrolase [Paenibacillaceae bacterium]|nr:cysteine hydrolase [Paenibacillaceae bacterium]
MIRLGNERGNWRVNKEHADLRRLPMAERPVSFQAEPQQVTVNMSQAALIVIDMQNDFCAPAGWLDSIGADYTPAQAPIEPLNRLLPVLRAAEVPIIWVNWGNRPDRLNLSPSVLHVYNRSGDETGLGGKLPGSRSRVLEKDSWGAAIVDELDVGDTDIHVDKYRMSGFWDTPLDSILRNLRVHTLFFAGVNMDQCVMSTLQDAVCLGYDSLLLTDCSATNSPAYCADATIYNVKQCYGFTASSADLLAGITRGGGDCE